MTDTTSNNTAGDTAQSVPAGSAAASSNASDATGRPAVIPSDPRDIKVALLAGGSSPEREISLASGDGAHEALIEAGYDVERLDPAKTEHLARLMEGGFDVAFLCVHGEGGEDGTLQGFLESIRLPYTCSGVASSVISMDKALSKAVYEKSGIQTPKTYTCDDHRQIPSDEKRVVKDPIGGSSINVYMAQNEEEAERAIEELRENGADVLIEQYIEGREVTVVVIGGEGSTRALPIIEIIPQGDSYDFDSKYAPGGSEHICPARLDGETTSKIQQAAIDAHTALGCHGVSRSDFILDADGEIWILETNTIPGMTKTSLLPDAARAAGMTFAEVCQELIQCAFEKDMR